MTNLKKPSKEMQLLRKRAEAELKNRVAQLPNMSVEQVGKLVHELHTHQIELEMQNEELRLTQEQLMAEHEKYLALYDFAPVGYFTFNEEGLIVEVNLTGAELLGVERRSLKNKPLSGFILDDDQDIFYRHWQKLLDTRKLQSCDLRIRRKDRTVCWMLITCVISESESDPGHIQFRSTMTDISEKKKEEEVLRNTVHELNQFNRFVVDRETRMIELKKQINELQKRLGETPEFPE